MLPKTLFLIIALFISGLNALSAQTYDEWESRSFDCLEADSLEAAEECLKRAMRLEPANAQNGLLFQNLGTIQRQLGRQDDALMSYSCAIALLDGVPEVRESRARLYAEMEKYADAIDDYTVLLGGSPQNETWLYERAMCRLLSHDTLGARLDLEYIDTFNPKSAKSRLGMAVVYKARKEYSLALDLYNALIEANPDSWSLLRDRAEVHYLSNRMGAALQDINESIKRHQQDPMSYALRAQIRYAKGDLEYARRDLNTAIEKGLQEEYALQLLGKIK